MNKIEFMKDIMRVCAVVVLMNTLDLLVPYSHLGLISLIFGILFVLFMLYLINMEGER